METKSLLTLHIDVKLALRLSSSNFIGCCVDYSVGPHTKLSTRAEVARNKYMFTTRVLKEWLVPCHYGLCSPRCDLNVFWTWTDNLRRCII